MPSIFDLEAIGANRVEIIDFGRELRVLNSNSRRRRIGRVGECRKVD